MICWPCFDDQKVNKVGFELKMASDRREIGSTIKSLMAGECAKEMKERALDLKNKVEQCAGVNASSYNKLNESVPLLMSL